MKTTLDQSDGQFLQALHRSGPQTVQEIGEAHGVTATAIRQRLLRLQGAGFVTRQLIRQGRGRPHFRYTVTEKGLRQLGDNYGDLALILWREIHLIADPVVREQIVAKVRDAMVARFGHVEGSLAEKLLVLQERLKGRGYDVEVALEGSLPVLREHNCPYQELAEQDRNICDLEREVFENLLGERVTLERCYLDGHRCCEFEIAGTASR